MLRHLEIRYDRITEDEGLESTIAYTLMNPVKANLCSDIYGYRWSSAEGLFQNINMEGKRVAELSGRERWRILKSRKPVHGNLLINGSGYVCPHSYVALEFVQQLFRTPKRLGYFLSRRKNTHEIIERSGMSIFRDQVVMNAIPDILRTRFSKEAVSELSASEMVELVFEMKYRFHSNSKQVARVTGLSVDVAEKLIE